MTMPWRPHLLALCLSLAPLSQAAAASSEWYESEGGRIRLVALPAAEDGSIRAMLDIRLQPGWKTYWRDPGESGIPPVIDVKGTPGVTLEGTGFPMPRQFDDGATRYIAYDHSVALPLKLRQSPGARADTIKASVFLGICDEICVPVQAELSVDVGAESFANPLEIAALDDAEARLPERASEDFRATSASWSGDGKTLSVMFRAPDDDGAPPEVLVSGPEGFQFGVARPTGQGDGSYSYEVPLVRKPKAADGKTAQLLLTVRSGARTMETPLVLD
ncbi:protein-disulfide reductase DsbD domain-containing protein [Sinorhizobium sp. BG8]|uniref:protein-disulfide reductase DsbD domain-containing protein n=1 Tax=Sinorhizobium sp. BG8 TaxID=2613773 RepID=UPI00193E01AE|nr:protein-disulfide reductase DsbD domain-containing protein [Sinorhizobium sp. BG8]QRM54575.1 hypothetical protein F3Y30_08465 [Sinorhizobium sp. BG8]